jgi:transposase
MQIIILTMYTNEEKIFLVKLRNIGLKYADIQRRFALQFVGRDVPNVSTISRIISKFDENGCIQSDHNTINRTSYILTLSKTSEIISLISSNNRMSTQTIANLVNVSKSSVHKVLVSNGYKAYHFTNHQELQGSDCIKRIEFYEWISSKLSGDPNFANKILFSDEATFTLNGEMNSQNCRYWSTTNLHLFNSTNNQLQQKLNVWCGIVGGKIIGPFYIEGNLNSEKYLELLRNRVIPNLEQNSLFEKIWFQQDGAPPHSSLNVGII